MILSRGLNRQQEGREKPPPAMLNHCRHPDRASILVPDYASWGNEGSLLAADDGRPLRFIDDQLRHLRVTPLPAVSPELMPRPIHVVQLQSTHMLARLLDPW